MPPHTLLPSKVEVNPLCSLIRIWRSVYPGPFLSPSIIISLSLPASHGPPSPWSAYGSNTYQVVPSTLCWPCDLTTPAHAFIHYPLAQTHTRWDLLCWLKQDDLGSVSLGFHDSLSISLSSHLSHSAENAWLPKAGKCIFFIVSWC